MTTYAGACHCRNIRYEAELDLSQPAIECNCSHCAMKGLLLQLVPADRLSILQGEEEMKEYRFNTHTIQHLFCTDCGVEPFGKGTDKEGNATAAINLRTIDGIDLGTVNRMPFDGKGV